MLQELHSSCSFPGSFHKIPQESGGIDWWNKVFHANFNNSYIVIERLKLNSAQLQSTVWLSLESHWGFNDLSKINM